MVRAAHYISLSQVNYDMSQTEIRKVQAYTGDRSLTIVLPKVFSERLGIGKGSFLKDITFSRFLPYLIIDLLTQ